LDDLDQLVERNRQRYLAYRELLDGIEGIALRLFDEEEQTSFKNILVRLDEKWPLSRDDTLAILQAEGALARPYYSPALHMHKAGFETRFGHLPVAERISQQYMLLPCGDQMCVSDIDVLVDLLSFLTGHGDEIGDALDTLTDLEIHTGYDPTAVRRSHPSKE
jgi:dTDP-4-amino-4,6-dideoxygalactose transaminase